MKVLRFTLGLFIFFILSGHAHSSTLGDLRLSYIEGDVQVRTEDTYDWVPVFINMPLREGDQLWLPDESRAEIQARNGVVVRIDERSSFEVLTVDRDSLQFYLDTGHAYVKFRDYRDSFVQIETPVSSIRAYNDASFRVDVSSDSDTDISVFKGTLYVENKGREKRVAAGRRLSISEDYTDLSSLGRADEWERWNNTRDRKMEERRYSSYYLPDELDSYSNDFDDYGRWVHVREYGYVWTPTIVVSADWSPYRNGRWAWIGGDYVWIAYEPWGWAPYHYGRWTHIVSIGWCWVPPARGAVHWGPGFVGWVATPSYVAWVPLAPGETYYGQGYYGPNSVNIINIDIHKTVIKNVYKNVRVRNAVTVHHNDTFIKGKHVDFRVKKNPFLTEKISIGRPERKAERFSAMPVLKDIPDSRKPPHKVRAINVKELKENRPMVKKLKSSVAAPESFRRTSPDKKYKTSKDRDYSVQPEDKSVSSRKYTTSEERDYNIQLEKESIPKRRPQSFENRQQQEQKEPERSRGTRNIEKPNDKQVPVSGSEVRKGDNKTRFTEKQMDKDNSKNKDLKSEEKILKEKLKEEKKEEKEERKALEEKSPEEIKN